MRDFGALADAVDPDHSRSQPGDPNDQLVRIARVIGVPFEVCGRSYLPIFRQMIFEMIQWH